MRQRLPAMLVLLFSVLLTAQPKVLQDQIFSARDKVMPALVHVEPIIKVYSQGEKQLTQVTGSGVIISGEGFVITNHHVAANAEKVWCTLSNKERITASVVGSDQSTDIAVLKLNLEELDDRRLVFAELGNSETLEVGQIVLALGSPLGLSRSVSMGVVSSIDRYFADRGSMESPFNLWIQTDAAINPGNSGGPLISLAGKVVGINARAVFFAENLGFAIPINLVKEVSEKIIQGSSVKRAWSGLDFQHIKHLREYLARPDLKGVLVGHVEPESPAEKAGIQPGDVITAIDGQPVNVVFEEELPTIRQQMANLPIDRSVTIKVWRAGKDLRLSLTSIEAPFVDSPEVEAPDWGLVIKNVSENIYRFQMLDGFNGIYISSLKPGGPGELTSLRRGDVIKKINGNGIRTDQEFLETYRQLRSRQDEPVFLEIVRAGFPYFAVLKLKPAP